MKLIGDEATLLRTLARAYGCGKIRCIPRSLGDDPMTEPDDYDNPWKQALEGAFPEFMAFYFPEAAARIDWQRGHEFLDQELRQVVRDAESGKRHVDKLARVLLLDGQEEWIYIRLYQKVV